MSNQDQSKRMNSEPAPIGCTGLIVRMLWLMAGTLALIVLAAFIYQRHSFSFIDLIFWGIVVGLILIRYIDITRLNGLTSDSEPATLKHWRIYLVKLLVGSAALWGLAHVVGALTRG